MTGKLKTVTLGCKVNQYETQYVREGLVGIGFEEAADREDADLCIVNTCTVTGEGDKKSRQIIRKLNRENPDARIVVMGCYATRDPDAVSKLPGVAEVITDKRELPDLLGRFGVIDIPNGISGLSHRSRAYVKVQDGCLLRCSYCIIPQVRPNMYSRPVKDILQEIQRLVENGYREIVLTGVHLGHYGVDFNFHKPKAAWVRLSHLLKQILQISDAFRIRLSSIEATEITRELLDVMAENPQRICPHFHVCLQSGSERILRLMKRRWGAKRFVDRCRLIRQTLNLPGLTTDAIVGFPGETEADFQATLDASRDSGFFKIHAFPFSARKGTPAAEMQDQLSKQEKSARVHRLTDLEAVLRQEYFDSLVGSQIQMLVESIDAETGIASGTSCRFAQIKTCIRQTAPMESVQLQIGQLVELRVTRNADTHLEAICD
jgi:threonylcarbamoyladenosine tRNA methylthiotransferase MtaB